MGFPVVRMRRLRQSPAMRAMVRETRLSVENLMHPLFVVPGRGIKKEISSLPGQVHLSVDKLLEEAKAIQDLGIPSVLLFAIPEFKDDMGTAASKDNGIIQQAVRALKEKVPQLAITTDLCFCEYTSHGHCGKIHNNDVDNDATLEMLAEQALSHARAGADIIAPSGMMDGMITTLRQALDGEGFDNVVLMSYAAKFASAFYGPFREAVQSAPQFGDRRTYQMDPSNVQQAIRETALDIEEGADIVMVKPALAFLDILSEVKKRFEIPTAAYNVSGEYAMVKAAGAKGWVDEARITQEILLSIRRAGADIIITYFAKDVAATLK